MFGLECLLEGTYFRDVCDLMSEQLIENPMVKISIIIWVLMIASFVTNNEDNKQIFCLK